MIAIVKNRYWQEFISDIKKGTLNLPRSAIKINIFYDIGIRMSNSMKLLFAADELLVWNGSGWVEI